MLSASNGARLAIAIGVVQLFGWGFVLGRRVYGRRLGGLLAGAGNGALSRNRFVGIELGKGRDLKEILADMKMVAEGVGTTAALLQLASEASVETVSTWSPSLRNRRSVARRRSLNAARMPGR